MSAIISIDDFYTPGDPDYTLALQSAINNGAAIFIPSGIYPIGSVSGTDVHIYGVGTLQKKAGTAGVLLNLTGNSRIEGVTIDGNAPNLSTAGSYFDDIAVQQVQGALALTGVKFRRSAYAAVYALGASLSVDAGCRFTEGKLHNGLTGESTAQPTHYIKCAADLDTKDQIISINGATFIGDTESATLHLNPTGIFITSYRDSSVSRRFKTISIVAAKLIACSTNAGGEAGNVTGAIDTYDGAENLTVLGCTIRFFTYAAIKAQNCSRFTISHNICTDGVTPTGAHHQQCYGITTTQKVRGSTVDERNGIVAFNIIEGLAHIGIGNNCDLTTISDNHVFGVRATTITYRAANSGLETSTTAGTGIDNSGNYVVIARNKLTMIEGQMIQCFGSNCEIDDNDLNSSHETASVVTRGGILVSGNGVKVRRNRLSSNWTGSIPGIRSNGPLSSFEIDENDIRRFDTGVDLRATGGAIDEGHIGRQRFVDVGTPFHFANATYAITNISRGDLQPCTVAQLPTFVLEGARAIVTDAVTPAWGTAPVGGGSARSPVYRDNTGWKIG
jgi:hypothetical protein